MEIFQKFPKNLPPAEIEYLQLGLTGQTWSPSNFFVGPNQIKNPSNCSHNDADCNPFNKWRGAANSDLVQTVFVCGFDIKSVVAEIKKGQFWCHSRQWWSSYKLVSRQMGTVTGSSERNLSSKPCKCKRNTQKDSALIFLPRWKTNGLHSNTL